MFFFRGIGWLPLLAVLLVSCGGGGGGGTSSAPAPGATSSIPTVTGNNSVTVTMAPSSASNPQINEPYITVTLCAGSNCVQINNVLVDTGSYGFRVPASVLASAGLSLSTQSVSGGSLVECSQFAGGYMWGWVKSATIQIGGETTATSIPIQVTDDSSPALLPAADNNCTSTGTLQNIGTVAGIGGNAIIGIGPMIDDGQRYYACTSSSCSSVCSGYGLTSATSCSNLFSEVSNPVASFTQDNNGVILQLASVNSSGSALTNAGTLTFGINTQSDNSIATGFQMVATAPIDPLNNPDGSYFAISYGCTTCNPASTSTTGFFDTGSNYTYVNLSSSQLQLNAQNIYTLVNSHGSPVTVTASLASTSTAPVATSFVIGNPINSTCPTCNAYNDIAASASYYGVGSQADLGMPYFYGRSIAFAIGGKTVSSVSLTAPFYAVKNP